MARGVRDLDTFLVQGLLRHLLVQTANQDYRPPQVHGLLHFLWSTAVPQCLVQCRYDGIDGRLRMLDSLGEADLMVVEDFLVRAALAPAA